MGKCRELIYLIIFIVLTWVIATYAVWYAWHYQDKSPDVLYDFLFQLFPNRSDITAPIPNYIGFAQMFLTLISLDKNHWTYVCQFLFLNSLVLLLRSFTSTLTLLPNIHTYEYCKERPTSFFDVVNKQINYGTCADYMFSGHTALVFLLYMFVHKHKKYYISELLSGLLVGAMIITLIILRWHYTIDIVVAIIIVFLLFKYYKDYENKNYWFYFSKLKGFDCNKSKEQRANRNNFER